MSEPEHRYNIRVPDDEINRRLAEQKYPYRDELVLLYLHFSRSMSTREIARLFGVSRQTLQNIVRGFEWRFRKQWGDSHNPERDQSLLDDYSDDDETSGLSDFI